MDSSRGSVRQYPASPGHDVPLALCNGLLAVLSHHVRLLGVTNPASGAGGQPEEAELRSRRRRPS